MNKYFKFVTIFVCCLSATLLTESRYKYVENSDTLVVLIHGIGDSPRAMWKIEKNLLKLNYSILNYEYASTKDPMDSIIRLLTKEINMHISKFKKIQFVAHSLGNFVVRGYLDQYQNKKFSNIVFIAPPGKGSILAERFENFKPFKWIFGETGLKLGKGHDDYWRKYPAPYLPFGIIAGGANTKHGFNPLVPGDDDGTVGVQETIIEGYTDYILIHGLHSTLLWQNEVIDQIVHFLQNSKFEK